MLNLLIAFAIILGLIALSYLSLGALGVPTEIAVNVSAVALGFIPQLREYLDKRKELVSTSEPVEIASFDGFGLPMNRLLLYASLLMFAAIHLAAFIGGLVHGMVAMPIPGTPDGYSREGLKVTHGIFVILIAFPLIFVIGRWVGKICISNGPVTIVLAALLAQLSGTVVGMFIMSKQENVQFNPVEDLLLPLSVGTVMFSIVGLIGFWRGQKQKISAYASYLLKKLPPEARKLMVKSLYEETRKISHSQIWPAPSSPSPLPKDNSSQAAHELSAAVIVGIHGPLRGKQFAVKKGIFRIGSNSDNDLVIKDDPHVSRHHAYLRYGQDGLSVVDQKSTNGTYLNEHRLADVPMAVNIGDRIHIGNSIFEVLPPPS